EFIGAPPPPVDHCATAADCPSAPCKYWTCDGAIPGVQVGQCVAHFVTAGTVCRASTGPCEFDATCSGNAPECPVNKPFLLTPPTITFCSCPNCATSGSQSVTFRNGESRTISCQVTTQLGYGLRAMDPSCATASVGSLNYAAGGHAALGFQPLTVRSSYA